MDSGVSFFDKMGQFPKKGESDGADTGKKVDRDTHCADSATFADHRLCCVPEGKRQTGAVFCALSRGFG